MSKKKVATTTKAEPPDGTFGYWLMTSFGVLMPAALPADIAAKHPPGTLQVRARDAAHLDHFREHWCPELQKTIITPQLDYDARCLVGAEALARAVSDMTLAVSARKFKPTTLGPDGLADKAKAKALHDTYVGVGNRVYRLSPKSTSWSAKGGGKFTTATPDPQASSEICQREGHLFPVGSKGGKARVVHCSDCDALRGTAPGSQVHYPANHQVWTPPATDDADAPNPADPFYVGVES